MTHTSGLPGIDDWSVNGGRLKFMNAVDIYKYCANRELLHKPGKTWDYSNIGAQLIACIVHQLTGQHLDKYLDARLLRPLHITKYRWLKTGGYTDAMSGLMMNVADLHKIGQCVVDTGLYDKKQIVPKKWIEMIKKPRVKLSENTSQGYIWFINRKMHLIYHDGSNGQYLITAPKKRAVLARVYKLKPADYKAYIKNSKIFIGTEYYKLFSKIITAK